MMYFVVCADKTYEEHYASDIHAVKLEDVSQLHGQRTPMVKYFNEDFPLGDYTTEIELEALAKVGFIYLVYAEWYDSEFIEDKYYPQSGIVN
jgi:hypothetical protein